MNKSKKAIVIGASSGIGKALARELVKKQLFCWNNRQERWTTFEITKGTPWTNLLRNLWLYWVKALEDLEKLTTELGD